MTGDGAGWRAYIDSFHHERAGITEQLLGRARGPGDMDPYQWASTVASSHETPRTVDLGCGSGPMADHVRGWIGVDASAAELRVAVAAGREPVVVAWAEALPMRTGSASEVVAAMSLMVVDDLDAVLSEAACDETTRPGTSRRSP